MPAANRPLLALIAAVARNRVIGREGGLVWHDSADQRHFRQVTQGHAVVMGRKTWDSLPERFRPLPNRRNVVVSRQPDLQLPGAEVQGSLAAALQALHDAPTIFVIGGGELYAQAMPIADELVLTEIDADLDGEVLFPAVDPHTWHLVDSQPAQSADGTVYRFARYRRAAD